MMTAEQASALQMARGQKLRRLIPRMFHRYSRVTKAAKRVNGALDHDAPRSVITALDALFSVAMTRLSEDRERVLKLLTRVTSHELVPKNATAEIADLAPADGVEIDGVIWVVFQADIVAETDGRSMIRLPLDHIVKL